MKARYAIAFLFAMLLMGARGVYAEPSLEFQVKGAFLCNFMKFIEWPNQSAQSINPRICIVGEDPFDGTLSAIANKALPGQSIQVLQFEKVMESTQDSLAMCNLVYVTEGSERAVSRMLSDVSNSAAVVVTDTRDLGMINLLVVDGKVRFQINQEAIGTRGVKVSSKLSSLAMP